MPGDPFYRSAAWIKARAAFLKIHSLCSVPGCPIAATHVDHIQTRRRAPHLALESTNFQAFCASHHNSKTAMRDRPSRLLNDAPLRVAGCDALGNPIDPGHAWHK